MGRAHYGLLMCLFMLFEEGLVEDEPPSLNEDVNVTSYALGSCNAIRSWYTNEF